MIPRNTIRSISLAIIIGLLCIPELLTGAGPLTPENAIEILYTHIKRVDYRPLLTLCVDPERKRLDTLLQKIEANRSSLEEAQKKAAELEGYIIHTTEKYETVAVITFSWKYRNDYKAAQPDIKNPLFIERGCEALLLKENNIWKLASTRPWIPDNERRLAFSQQQNSGASIRN
jgi:hypothetical protein